MRNSSLVERTMTSLLSTAPVPSASRPASASPTTAVAPASAASDVTPSEPDVKFSKSHHRSLFCRMRMNCGIFTSRLTVYLQSVAQPVQGRLAARGALVGRLADLDAGHGP